MPKRDIVTEMEPEAETDAPEEKNLMLDFLFWSFKEERLLEQLVLDAVQLNGKQLGMRTQISALSFPALGCEFQFSLARSHKSSAANVNAFSGYSGLIIQG